MLGIFQLQGHQEADSFQGIGSSIDIVAHEDIVKPMDITLIRGSLPDVEKSHKVSIVSEETAEDLDRWLDVSDDNRLDS